MWDEVLVDDNWIHLDPCEAAVDEPLIYEGWGKNQTYIFAFSRNGTIEDVTAKYTTDIKKSVERRDASEEDMIAAISAAKSTMLN